MKTISTELLKKAFRESQRDVKSVWARGWITFIGCAIVLELSHYLLLLWGEFINPDWGPQLADFLAGLLVTGTYIMIIPLYCHDVRTGRPTTNFWTHIHTHTNQVVIEMIRVIAKVLVGVVLLIVPGIVWSIRYTFVPLVAQFNKAYLSGKIDALKQSENMVRGHFWFFFFLNIGLLFVGLLESYKYVYFYSAPLLYVVLVGVNLIIEVYVYTFFFSIYDSLEPKEL